ncbi:MAG: homoserine acetyltransferase [Flavobacteriaceae bacterium TMED179]|nr:MAG: homoserine acetyltransferase [Flavobacteriaceae bacterium TMED179]|tara:strand:+ start:3392 stop:4357 length:966 start_codon:yes stop_codon:yes gene_type:complete
MPVPQIKTISINDFTTHSGAIYTQIDLHYQEFGQRIGKAPVVMVNHSLTGDSQLTGKGGWWNEIIGPKKTIDTHLYTVLGFNIPGNGVKDQTFSNPDDFHAGDIASLFLRGLNILNIKKLYALIGGSIGGGIAWEMAAIAPKLCRYLVPIAADWKSNDWIIANTFLQKRILINSKQPLEDARIHAMLTYRTPQSFEFRFGRTKNQETGVYNIESWLMYHGDKLAKRFHLKSYIMMNHLLASVNIEREGRNAIDIIKNITGEIHLIAIDSDLFFTPKEDQETFALANKIKKDIFYHELSSLHGHDAFLIENEDMIQILSDIF